jgi:hypothetical protein
MSGDRFFARLVPTDWDVVGEVPLRWLSNGDAEPITVRGNGHWDFRFFEPPLGSDGGTPIVWPVVHRSDLERIPWPRQEDER